MSGAATIVTDDGARLSYRLDGRRDGPPILLLNSLGTDLRMWAPQVEPFGREYLVVRYDTRGHGASGVGAGPYTIERLGLDALALLDALGIERAHVCGVSLGGLTALWLAVHRPERVAGAVLANTAARIGTAEGWDDRVGAVRAGGIAAVRDTVLRRFFSLAFHAARPGVVQATGNSLGALDPAGYVAACLALRDADLRSVAASVRVPTLVIGGELDEATPPSQAEELYRAIRGSRLVVLPGAAHLSNLEQPDAFNRAVLDFFRS